MSVDVFSFKCSALPTAAIVGFKGTEYVSRPYEFNVYFTVPLGTDVRSAVGQRATLLAARGEGREPVNWHGVLVRVRLLHQVAERALYQALLVPKLWILRHYYSDSDFLNCNRRSPKLPQAAQWWQSQTKYFALLNMI